jgi:hypothetical protein
MPVVYTKCGHLQKSRSFFIADEFFDCNQAILSLGEGCSRSAASDPNTEQYTLEVRIRCITSVHYLLYPSRNCNRISEESEQLLGVVVTSTIPNIFT